MNWPTAVVAAVGIFCGAGFLIAMLAFFAFIVHTNYKED